VHERLPLLYCFEPDCTPPEIPDLRLDHLQRLLYSQCPWPIRGAVCTTAWTMLLVYAGS